MVSCKSDSSDLLFVVNDEAAQALYSSSLKSVIDTKCISCHEFHLEGASRYDNYEKTKAAIGQMVQRINSDGNNIMPPPESEAGPLTDAEKQSFNDLLEILNSSVDEETVVEEEEKPFIVNWIAYKYPDRFEGEGREGAGVGGTFDDIEYSFNTAYDNTIDILRGAKITINTSSVNVANNEPTRTTNVGMFFEFFTPDIVGEIVAYDLEQAIVAFTMNNITDTVTLDIELDEVNNIITLSGSVPNMNDFNWAEGYNVLEEICGTFHEGMLWPDVDIEAIIDIDKLNIER